jgi:phosphoribosylformylglycinamidine synthase
LHQLIATAISRGLLLSCHDCIDGGLSVAAAEMCIASGLGLEFRRVANQPEPEQSFEENRSQYLVEVSSNPGNEWMDRAMPWPMCVSVREIARVVQEPNFRLWNATEVSVSDLTKAWRGTLDW